MSDINISVTIAIEIIANNDVNLHFRWLANIMCIKRTYEIEIIIKIDKNKGNSIIIMPAYRLLAVKKRIKLS